MGMFDSIWVACPKCGEEIEFQSKSGDCSLKHYTLQDCPDDVMININRHSPQKCKCGALLEIDIKNRKVVLLMKKESK